MNHNASLLGKNLSMLFWLIIIQIVISIFSMIPVLGIVAMILSLLCSVAYGYLLYKLAPESENYHKAGLFYFILAAISLLSLILGRVRVLAVILSLANVVVGVLAVYCEFHAHGEVVAGYDAALAGKWETLWKLYIAFALVDLIGLIIGIFAPVVGSVIISIASIISLVVFILKLVDLNKEAKLFNQMAGNA